MDCDDTQNEWELSKENVQPLKQGRKFANLSMALQSTSVENLSRLRTERQQYELSLRTYDGDDPLSVWDIYIQWTEQNFPKGGKESNLSQLLQQCVSKFKDEEKYKNDERYLKLWLKFVNFCSDPVEIFSFLYDQQIGTKHSLLYEAWSAELERLGNTKKADIVFENGLKNCAEPLEYLRKKHSEFQTRVTRQTLGGAATSGESSVVEPVDERSTLGELKAHGKKARVAHDRVAGARQGGPRGLQMQGVKPLSNKNGPGFSVYSDENADPCPLPPQAGEWMEAPSRGASKENEQKPGVWTSAKVKQKHTPVVDVKDVSRHCQNQFAVYVEENVPQPVQTPRKPIEVNQVLSARKPPKSVDPFFNMQQLNEPGNLRPMYPKHKVYTGAGEMSLEELRAAEWRERENKRIMEEQAQLLRAQQEEVARQKEELRLQREALQQEHEQLRLQQQQLTVQREQVVKAPSLEKMDTSSLDKRDQPAVLAEPSGERMDTSSTDRLLKPTMNVTPNISLLRPTPDNSQLSGSMRSSLRSLGTPRSGSLSAPSPTVNTREAMQVVMGMFNNTLDIEKNMRYTSKSHIEDDSDFDNQFAGTTGQEGGKKTVPFTIFDENARLEQKPAAPFAIFDENQANQSKSNTVANQNAVSAPFAIYTDQETSVPSTSKPKGLQPRNILAANTISKTEEQEPIKQVPLNNEPMTVHERVHRANLEWDVSEQTQIISTGDGIGELHDFDGGDMTFAPGLSSTINFTAAARLASTPFNPTGDMAAFPEPPISTIKTLPPAVSDAHSVMTESSLMSQNGSVGDPYQQHMASTADKRRASNFVETGGTNLSPIMEQSDEDKNQTASKSHQGAFANVTQRDHHASHSHIAHKDRTGVEHSTIGAPTPKPLALNTMEQSSLHKSSHVVEEIYESPPPPPPAANQQDDYYDHLDAEEDESPGNMSRLVLNNMTMHEIDLTNYVPPDDSDPRQQHLLDMSVAIDPNDPFDEALVARFLSKLATPIDSYESYVKVDGPLPVVKANSICSLGEDMYRVSGKMGEGAYAKVFRCVRMDQCEDDDMDLDEETQVLKVQQPACPWEFYITQELHARLGHLSTDYDIRPSIMKIERGYFFEDGSCLLNQMHKRGTLLDLVNIFKELGFAVNKKKDTANHMLCVYMTIELLHIAEKLRQARVIHGDIKPDNILIIDYLFQIADIDPQELICGESKILKLIDFGRSIDLTMFPEGTTFTAKVTTSGFQCIEMMTNRPWTYQTDLFNLAGCMHVLLFEEYMKVYQEAGTWRPTQQLTRYVSSRNLYKALFNDLLNIPSCDELPDVTAHRLQFEKFFLAGLKNEKTLNEFRQCLQKLTVQYYCKG